MDRIPDNTSGIKGIDTPPPSTALKGAMAVLAASLANGSSRLHHARLDQPVNPVIQALVQLGIDVRVDEDKGRIDVAGRGGHWIHSDIELDCGNDARVTCLLLAACCLGRGHYQLVRADTETAAVRSLTSSLVDLGQHIRIESDQTNPRIGIAAGSFRGGRTAIRDPLACDAVPALLIVAPTAMGDLFLELPAWPSRPPCITDALTILDRFGIAVIDDFASRLIIPAPQAYAACEFDLEGHATQTR